MHNFSYFKTRLYILFQNEAMHFISKRGYLTMRIMYTKKKLDSSLKVLLDDNGVPS